jgi:hypothetical protein
MSTLSGKSLVRIVFMKKIAVTSTSFRLLTWHKVKGFTEFVNGSVIINPLTFYLNIGLVHVPRTTCHRVSTLRFNCNQGRIFYDPLVQRCMINCRATFFRISSKSR